MPDLPSSLSLTSIADGADIVASDHRNNYTAIADAVNALRAALAGGANGQVLTATDADTVAWGPTWSTYTPTWTGTGTNPAIGNGTITGRYVQVGKVVHAHVEIAAGSTTTFGSAGWIVSLPVTAKSGITLTALVRYADASTGEFIGFARTNDADSITLFIGGVGSVANLATGTAPFTFTTSDKILIEITYEAA